VAGCVGIGVQDEEGQRAAMEDEAASVVTGIEGSAKDESEGAPAVAM
jgi:hypothetical protein